MTHLRVRSVLAAGAVIGVAATLTTGCGEVNGTKVTHTTVEDVAITEIQIEKGSGDVTVRSGAPGKVSIERTVTYTGKEPAAKHHIDGKILVLPTSCGVNCGVSYTIEAPPDVAVTGENGSGNVTVSDAGRVDVRMGSGNLKISGGSGTVTAEGGSGDIDISDVRAKLVLKVKSGNITGRGIGDGPVTAEAGSGDISAELSQPGSVTAKSGSGDIKITVPQGAYHIVSTVSPDDSTFDVDDDPGATHTLSVSSGSGNVRIKNG